MHRDHWHRLRGYPELYTASHIDGYMCAIAASSGLRETALPYRYRIYHQEHPRAVDFGNLEANTRPLKSYEAYASAARRMLERAVPEGLNDDGWGLGAVTLAENVPHQSGATRFRAVIAGGRRRRRTRGDGVEHPVVACAVGRLVDAVDDGERDCHAAGDVGALRATLEYRHGDVGPRARRYAAAREKIQRELSFAAAAAAALVSVCTGRLHPRRSAIVA